MDDICNLENKIAPLLDAMLLIPKAFVCLEDAKIEVRVDLERRTEGYTPSLSTYLKGAIAGDPDISSLKSEVASKAVSLASALEEEGTAVLRSALLGLHPVSEIGYADLEVDDADQETRNKLKISTNRWLSKNTNWYWY